MPILTIATPLATWQPWTTRSLTCFEAVVMLAVFGGLMAWTIWQGLHKKADTLVSEMEQELDALAMPIRRAVFWLVVGLVLLIVSSRILVWGAVQIAHGFGVSDLIIGLAIVAIGTTLPELASSIIAARQGEHDIALRNILGANLCNTLAVVGITGTLHPLVVGPEVFKRDTGHSSGLCQRYLRPNTLSRLRFTATNSIMGLLLLWGGVSPRCLGQLGPRNPAALFPIKKAPCQRGPLIR